VVAEAVGRSRLTKDAAAVPSKEITVLDGEIVCVDRKGRPQFRDLLFRRGDPCFFSFDLLVSDGKDWRRAQLLDRKDELRRLLARVQLDSRLRYVDHVDGSGVALFQRVCKLDLEGIVAKQKSGPYIADRENSTWFKIRNREYSQMAGREKLLSANDTRNQFQDGILACWLVPKKRAERYEPLRSCCVRKLSEAEGFPCTRIASKQCSDCGIEICESHVETCGMCDDVFCPSCLSFSSSGALEACHSGSKQRKETQNCLMFLAGEPIIAAAANELTETDVSAAMAPSIRSRFSRSSLRILSRFVIGAVLKCGWVAYCTTV
jgi:ATP dependent DNA ligase domain